MDRAAEVLNEIKETLGSIKQSQIKLGQLFSEAIRMKFYKTWGFSTIREWLESSDVGLPYSTLLKLVTIAERSTQVGVSQRKLEGIPITKLAAIFSLDSKENKQEIRRLVADANNLGTEEIRELVYELKGDNGLSKKGTLQITVGAMTPNTKKVIISAINRAQSFGANTQGDALRTVCNYYLQNNKLKALSAV